MAYTQWSESEGTYTPVDNTLAAIDPGYYDLTADQSGRVYFTPVRPRTDDLIRFPDSASLAVLEGIADFWDREARFAKYDLPFKRGILLYGPPGCHAAGTQILMADGTTKVVEDVAVGDQVMGPDSQPRDVLALARGTEDMYRVTPVKGESFDVNASHVLSLQRSGDRDQALPKVLNVTVREFLRMSAPSRTKFKLRKTGIEYPSLDAALSLDPYFLGVWLGDGTASQPAITTADPEIEQLIYRTAEEYGLHVSSQRKTSSLARTYRISGTAGVENPITRKLRALDVLSNKHIPDVYLRASREDRLALLAGIVDTDGGYSTANWRPSQKYSRKGYGGFFEVSQNAGLFADQIATLARGLGFGVTVRTKTNDFGNYNRINIYGPISEIPTRVARKQAAGGMPNKDHHVTGIASVEPLGGGEYYGFTLSGDHLYLTGDFTVHHNSGKTCTLQLIAKDVVQRGGIVLTFPGSTSLFLTAYRALRDIQPETPIVVLMEDFEATVKKVDESRLLNLLDGVERLHKCVFLATTNYPELLESRIMNRPSRFDVLVRVDHPSEDARRLYMTSLLHDGDDLDVEAYVRDTHGLSLAHVKELFVATHILGGDYAVTVKRLKTMKEGRASSKDDGVAGTAGWFGFGPIGAYL